MPEVEQIAPKQMDQTTTNTAADKAASRLHEDAYSTTDRAAGSGPVNSASDNGSGTSAGAAAAAGDATASARDSTSYDNSSAYSGGSAGGGGSYASEASSATGRHLPPGTHSDNAGGSAAVTSDAVNGTGRDNTAPPRDNHHGSGNDAQANHPDAKGHQSAIGKAIMSAQQSFLDFTAPIYNHQH